MAWESFADGAESCSEKEPALFAVAEASTRVIRRLQEGSFEISGGTSRGFAGILLSRGVEVRGNQVDLSDPFAAARLTRSTERAAKTRNPP